MSRIILFSLIIHLLLTGCSLFVEPDIPGEQLLLNHLQNWQNFRLEGIAEISVNHLRLRKNIHIVRNEEVFKLSIIESGIFGLRPAPLLSIVVDSTLTVSSPEEMHKMLGELPADSDLLNIEDINNIITTLKENRDLILRDGRVKINQTEFVFNDKMQFDRISTKDKAERELLITFHYRRDDTLNRIVVHAQDQQLLEISVDRMTYGTVAFLNVSNKDKGRYR